MKSQNPFRTLTKELKQFSVQNTTFDLMRADLHDRRTLAKLNWKGVDREELLSVLRVHQRLLRVAPDHKAAEALWKKGFDSAHAIAALPEHTFLREYTSLFSGGLEEARKTHRRAVQVKSKLKHVFGNARDLIGSPHYQSTLFHNAHPDVVEYFKNIPSYEDLFGSTDYFAVEHCQSILGPAAYFTDLMRITDQYITDPNKNQGTIPQGFLLEERRRDLFFTLHLDCKETNTVVPYLNIVNNVIEQKIETEVGKKPYEKLAVSKYPFNLPFNLPSVEIRRYLNEMDASLASIYEAYCVPPLNRPGVKPIDVARESLGISLEELAILTTPNSTPENVGVCYGYAGDAICKHLPYKGAGSISFQKEGRRVVSDSTNFHAQFTRGDQIVCNGIPRTVRFEGSGSISIEAGKILVEGNKTWFLEEAVIGDTITCKGQSRVITSITDNTKLAVDTPWNDTYHDASFDLGSPASILVDAKWPLDAVNQPYEIAPADGLHRVEVFLGRSGLTLDKLQQLFIQSLDSNELKTAGNTELFINATGETDATGKELPFLQIVLDEDDPGNIYSRIVGLSLRRLDRLSRFIRLANKLNWSYEDLNWVLVSTAHLGLPGSGAITVSSTLIDVYGTDETCFDLNVRVGDAITCFHEVRTVTQVVNATQIRVDSPFSLSATTSEYSLLQFDCHYTDASDRVQAAVGSMDLSFFRLGLPPDLMRGAPIMLDHSAIDPPGVTSLGLRSFVGRGMSLPLQHVKVDAPFSISGAPVGNIVTFFWKTSKVEITQRAIQLISAVKTLRELLNIPIDELSAFWFEMKTTGRVVSGAPQDLFDRIFNNPLLLAGRNPYVNPDVPFNPDIPLEWNIEKREGEDAMIRNRLLAALTVSDADLTLVSKYLLNVLAPGTQSLTLSLTNLTWLYRCTRLPLALGLAIDEFLVLVSLLYYPESEYLVPPIVPFPSGITSTRRIVDTARWMKNFGLNAYQLRYMLTGVSSVYVDPGYSVDAVKPFIESLATLADGSRIRSASFIFEDIDADEASAVLEQIMNKFIDPDGILLNKEIIYDDLCYIYPVDPTLFVEIDADQAENVFLLLCGNGIVARSGNLMEGTLSESFTALTPLNFLFVSKGAGQKRTVNSYDGVSKEIVVDRAWDNLKTPDDTSYYKIDYSAEGYWTDLSQNTITLDNNASSVDGSYVGMTVKVVDSTSAPILTSSIVTYDGLTRKATVEPGWAIPMPLPTPPNNAYKISGVFEGKAQGAGRTTLFLASSAPDVPDYFKGAAVQIVDNPHADVYRGQVRDILVQIKRDIDHTRDVLLSGRTLQEANTFSGLAQFLSSTPEMLEALLPFVSKTLQIIDYLQDFLAPVPKTNATVFAMYITPISLVTDIIDEVASRDAYKKLLDKNLLEEVDPERAIVTDLFADHKELDFLFKNDDLATDKRDQVRTILSESVRFHRVADVVAVISRALVLTNALRLTPAESSAIASHPEAFNIEDVSSNSLSDIRSITLFKSLKQQFDDSKDLLLEYLQLPASASQQTKNDLLSKCTGWSVDQIEALDNLFWSPLTSERRDPLLSSNAVSVDKVEKLKKCFDAAALIGTDVYFLLKLCGLSELVTAGKAQAIASDRITLDLSASVVNDVYVRMQIQISYITGLPEEQSIQQTRTIVTYDGITRVAFIDKPWDPLPVGDVIYTVQVCPLEDSNGACIHENWEQFSDIARSTLDVVNAKYSASEFEEPYAAIRSSLETRKRDVLLGFAIWYLGNQPDTAFIKSSSDLYQFLLIDVEMSSCAITSTIAQAISSVQLYMQRCRMRLEPGVDKIEVQDVWWDWMSNYRIWEANRKIFLYPENYIDPSLRQGSSPEFDNLKSDLLQTNITDDTVSTAYRRYFEEFSKVAQLVVVDSYKTSIGMNSIDPRETLFLFARTNTEPYTYYFRSCGRRYIEDESKSQLDWKPWEKIDLTINADTISSVYVYDRLYIFWVEPETKIYSSVSSEGSSIAETTQDSVYSKSLKFSYYTLDHGWLQPQSMTRPIVSDFVTTKNVNGKAKRLALPKWKIDPSRINPNAEYWQKPFVIAIPARASSKQNLSGILNLEQPTRELGLWFGEIYALPDQGVDIADVPLPKKPGIAPSQYLEKYEFDFSIYAATQAALYAQSNAAQGYLLLSSLRSIPQSVKEGRDCLVLLNNPANNVSSFRPMIDTTGSGTLGIIQTENILFDNSYGDYPNAAQNPVTGVLPLPFTTLLYNLENLRPRLLNVKNQLGWFTMDTTIVGFLLLPTVASIPEISTEMIRTDIPWSSSEINIIGLRAKMPDNIDPLALSFEIFRLTTSTVEELNRKLGVGISALLSLDSQRAKEVPVEQFYDNNVRPQRLVLSTSSEEKFDRLDFDGAYGAYFWEVFFHAPFFVADRLAMNRRFDEARQWYQYIFNPTAAPAQDDAHPADRFWRFLPFRSMRIEDLAYDLQNTDQIKRYNDDPFDPDAVAQLRHSAYAKGIVMKYINNLLNWGDDLFTQDTQESITQATNLYIMAADLLGNRPKKLGNVPLPEPKTFDKIRNAYPKGHIPEFLIGLENSLFAHCLSEGISNNNPLTDIDLYFAIPENPEFIQYWDRVEDRLYKIRHCLNIHGVERQLPLFEPPINPRELIRAAASRGGGLSIQRDTDVPVPNYRFDYLLERARAFTGDVSQFGSALLNALASKDAEQLAMLNANQSRVLLNMSTALKQLQIEATIQTTESLQESLASAEMRQKYYDALYREFLSGGEKESIEAAKDAYICNMVAGALKAGSSIAYAIPQLGSPFAMTYGGQQIGAALMMASTIPELLAINYNYVSQSSQTMAGYQRRSEDWDLQKRLAEFDVAQIQAQIRGNVIAQQIAERDLAVQELTIEQNTEMEQFLKTKFTNQDLYIWMVRVLSELYFQVYSLAFDLARTAQRAYQYELNTNRTFINFGYWDDLHKGLLAGEGLMLALDQMQRAYIDTNVRPMEITKNISLLSTNPQALLELKAKGECTFAFSEKLFDLDYPGHYCRKIKTVSVTIPSLIGPYQSLKATLIQEANQIILQPNPGAVKFLLGEKDAPAPQSDVLRSNWRLNQQVVLSRGVNDYGLFETNLNDERYLPFEGTGVVSQWRLRLPLNNNLLDFSGISDVVVQLQYTALDGGRSFREEVSKNSTLKSYSGMKFLDLRQMYSQDWFAFMNPSGDAANQQTISFDLQRFVPANVKGGNLVKIFFKLDVAPGVDLKSVISKIQFQLTSQMTLTPVTGKKHDCMIELQPQPDVNEVEGVRSIAFTVQQKLTPDILRDVILILFYDAELR